MAKHRKKWKKARKTSKRLRWVLIPIFIPLNFEANIDVEISAILRAAIPIQTIVVAGLDPAIHFFEICKDGCAGQARA
ncbi:MAG: hypothetical protein V4602_13860 [Pseudomonadota bacterium]